MKRKVLIIIPVFGLGGAENMVSQIVSNFNLNVFDVEVVCIFGKHQNNKIENQIIDAGIKINYLNKGLGFSINAVKKLWILINKFEPDIINTHLSACVYTAPWVLFHKTIMLHTLHTTPSIESIGLRRFLMKILYKTGKSIPIAISDEIKNKAMLVYHLESKYVEVIYNPVNLNRFSNAAKTKRSSENIIFLNVGRIEEVKNQAGLIFAFSKLSAIYPNIILYIVGEGRLRKNLEIIVKDLNLQSRVFFTGNINKVEDFYALAHIFILPSLYEGLPLTILEAMASKLPIIASNVGGVSDIVSDNGILVKPSSEKELIKAMIMLIENKAIREKMGEASLINVAKYDIKYIAKQYEDVFLKYSHSINSKGRILNAE